MMNKQNSIVQNLMAVFLRSIRLFKKDMLIFVAIGIFFGLANFVSLALVNILPAGGKSVFVLANLLLSGIATIMAIDAAALSAAGKPLDLKELFILMQTKYLNYIAVAAGVLIISSIGALLFIIPGLLALTFLLFADLMVVLERTTVVESFRFSFQLVKQNFWNVLIFNLITNVIILGLLLGKTMLLEQTFIGKMLDVVIMVIIPPFYSLLKVVYYQTIRPADFAQQIEGARST